MSHVGQVPPDSSLPPEGSADPRRLVAKLDYEIGLSLRTIGAKVGVSGETIRKWATEGGWTKGAKRPVERPPVRKDTRAAKVAAAMPVVQEGGRVDAGVDSSAPTTGESCQVDSSEVSTEGEVVNSGHDQPLDVRFHQRVQELLANPTPDQAVDVAARAVVQVVHGHRRGVMRAQALCDKLLGQLDVASDTRDLLEEFIHEQTEPGKYRSMLMRLVNLSTHAGTMRDLATAMQKLVQLERQAFGLADKDDPTPPAPPAEAVRVDEDAFTQIRDRARARVAAAAAVQDVEVKQ